MDFLIPRTKDILDILIITFLIYQSLLIVRKSGAYQILYGLLIIFAVYLLATIFELTMISDVLNAFRSYWILALIILFQGELRSFLARLSISRGLGTSFQHKDKSGTYGSLVDAVSSMAFRKTGALIVIEGKRKLNEHMHTGDLIDAQISLRLLLSIFNTKSVLHDGAVIIRNDRIIAAKVVLPLSKNPEYTKKLGTRHLAGLGISEVSDSISIIVSEQSGKISVAQAGEIKIGIAFEELIQIITDAGK